MVTGAGDRVGRLGFGSHDEGSGEMCVMEAVAQLAGEGWTDRPATASPVISGLLRSWNDGIGEQDRRLLAELVPLLPGTASSLDVENRRTELALDWHCRVYTAAWLRAAQLPAQADRLERARVDEKSELGAVRAVLKGARSAAADLRAGLRDGAEESVARAAGLVPVAEAEATWAAAWDAWLASNVASSRVAAVAAAGSSAWDSEHWAGYGMGRETIGQELLEHARCAARDAAWVVACTAAWSVTWPSGRGGVVGRASWWDTAYRQAEDAAAGALRPTMQALQASFLGLIKELAHLRSAG